MMCYKKHLRDDVYTIHYSNNHLLGEAMRDVDGYYKLWMEPKGGLWDAEVLREISNILDNMNKEWHQEVMEFNEI